MNATEQTRKPAQAPKPAPPTISVTPIEAGDNELAHIEVKPRSEQGDLYLMAPRLALATTFGGGQSIAGYRTDLVNMAQQILDCANAGWPSKGA